MKLYSRKKFAELAGVSVKTLKRWRKSGKLSPVLIDGNGKIFYSENQLETGGTLFHMRFAREDKFKKSEIPTVTVSETFTNKEVISVKFFEDFFNFVKIGKPKPIKHFIIRIDIVSKECSNPIYETGKRKILEFKNPKIFSYLSVESSLGLPTAFDELIYRAIISEVQSDRDFITPSMLYRDIGGSAVNDVSAAWKDKILNSVKKLARTWISYKIPIALFNRMKYELPDKFKEIDDFVCFEGHLLDCQFIALQKGDEVIDNAFKVNSVIIPSKLPPSV